jgi:hypothetical protein
MVMASSNLIRRGHMRFLVYSENTIRLKDMDEEEHSKLINA